MIMIVILIITITIVIIAIILIMTTTMMINGIVYIVYLGYYINITGYIWQYFNMSEIVMV